MNKKTIVLVLFLLVVFSLPVWAANEVVQPVKAAKSGEVKKAEAPKSEEKKPEAVKSNDPKPAPKEESPEGKVRVMVEHQGTDVIGLSLAHELKETITESKRFALTREMKNVLIIRVVTVSEMPDRPWFGSAYSLTWTFLEDPEVLSYYLDCRLGVARPEQSTPLAGAMMEMTDKVVKKYSYLFESQ